MKKENEGREEVVNETNGSGIYGVFMLLRLLRW